VVPDGHPGSMLSFTLILGHLGEYRIKRQGAATMATTHKGECFCGAVHVEVSGEPEVMGYCHCRSCRSWSGGPVNAFTLWKPDAVRVTAGAEHVAMFQKTEVSQRQYCRKCGGHLMANHPPLGWWTYLQRHYRH
jgi:hypothetical protein